MRSQRVERDLRILSDISGYDPSARPQTALSLGVSGGPGRAPGEHCWLLNWVGCGSLSWVLVICETYQWLISPGSGWWLTPAGVSATVSLGTLSIEESIVEAVTGQSMTLTVGNPIVIGPALVEPAGLELTASLGDETAFTDVTIDLTGFSLSSSLGTIRQESGYPVAGLGLTSSIGSVNIVATAVVYPSGLGLTASANATAFAYSPVDKGSSVTYSEVSKGTSITYTEVDKTAA